MYQDPPEYRERCTCGACGVECVNRRICKQCDDCEQCCGCFDKKLVTRAEYMELQSAPKSEPF